MERINLRWQEAKDLLQNADVLLFRGNSWYSKWLAWAGNGDYTHAAIAAKYNGHWSQLEYKEFAGSRVVDLEGQVQSTANGIDVYRLCQSIKIPIYNKKENRVDYITKEFGPVTRRIIADTMFVLSGRGSYSWKRIWRLAKYHVPFLRWFQKASTDDQAKNPEDASMVCSTAVAYIFRTNGIDLVPHLSDFEVVPSALARSSYLSYLFTLVP